jgi:hypothetical protein
MRISEVKVSRKTQRLKNKVKNRVMNPPAPATPAPATPAPATPAPATPTPTPATPAPATPTPATPTPATSRVKSMGTVSAGGAGTAVMTGLLKGMGADPTNVMNTRRNEIKNRVNFSKEELDKITQDAAILRQLKAQENLVSRQNAQNIKQIQVLNKRIRDVLSSRPMTPEIQKFLSDNGIDIRDLNLASSDAYSANTMQESILYNSYQQFKKQINKK